MRLEQRFLHHVGRIEFALKPRVELDPCEQTQIFAIRFQRTRATADVGILSHQRLLEVRTC